MSMTGDLRSHELAEVILTAGWEKLTGILAVKTEREMIGLSFVNGDIVTADSLSLDFQRGLAEILVAERVVTEKDLAALSAEHEESGVPLTVLLVDRGFVDPQQLDQALRVRTLRLCLEALRWQDGEFKFYKGKEVATEERMSPIPAEVVLLEAAEKIWEGGGGPDSVPTTESVYRRATPEDLVDTALRGVVEALRGGLVDPGQEGGLILELVNGARSAAEIAEATGFSDDKVRLSLYLLRRAGQVLPVDPGETAAAGEVMKEPEAVAPVEEGAATASEAEAPDEPAPKPSQPVEKPKIPQRADQSATARWPGRLMATVVLVGALTLALFRPFEFLLPHAWQEPWREALGEERRSAVFLKVDRSARTFYLLEGRYPESAREFEGRYLLSAGNLGASQGRELLYSSASASYQITEIRSDRKEPTVTAGSIAGNFLLDPDFTALEVSESPALVLLD